MAFLLGVCVLLQGCELARRAAPGGFLRENPVQPSEPNPLIEARIKALQEERVSGYPSLADAISEARDLPSAAERDAARAALADARDGLSLDGSSPDASGEADEAVEPEASAP
ncbi:MAG: hypothetical protein AAGH48_07965 [Pseudomonadota bacterium]